MKMVFYGKNPYIYMYILHWLRQELHTAQKHKKQHLLYIQHTHLNINFYFLWFDVKHN